MDMRCSAYTACVRAIIYHPGEEMNELDRLKRRGPLIESIQMTSQKEKQNAKKEKSIKKKMGELEN